MQSNIALYKYLLIGEVKTDLHLDPSNNQEPFVRLGGIFHASRAFNACGIKYAMGYYSPSYLIKEINEYSNTFNAEKNIQLGIINGRPNITFISESTEAGDQGYRELLKDQVEVEIINSTSELLSEYNPTDIIIYPGCFDLADVFKQISGFKCNVHIDLQYDCEDFEKYIKALEYPIRTVIISTSSSIFKKVCEGLYKNLVEYFAPFNVQSILLKENRGGSRYFNYSNSEWTISPAFPVSTAHSVGVGDCFNSVFIDAINNGNNEEFSLRKAAYFSSLYASTWDYNQYLNLVAAQSKSNMQEILLLKGVKLPWEERIKKSIYIAAPDFPDVDCRYIDLVANSLKYHNFDVHLPVRENGLITGTETDYEQDMAFSKDLTILNSSDLVIAVLIYNDPGTLLELGIAAQAGIPTILFDPYGKAKNLFLRKLPKRLCKTLSEVIDSTFELLGGE